MRCQTVPMPGGDGWYFLGPLLAVALGGLCLIARQPDRPWVTGRDTSEPRSAGLAILGFTDDYGLLCPAAVTDDPRVADQIQVLLGAAGIRATQAVAADGRLAVLVFPEELDTARRLVGGSAPL
jgi:hypothetical protein